MSWVFWALASAVLASTSAIIEKNLLNKEHAMEFGATLSVASFVFVLPLAYWADFRTLTPASVLIIYFISLLASIAFVLVLKAVRHMEVSTVSPLLILRPAFIAVLAFIFLGEALSRLQVGGILLLLLGTYILETHKESKLLDPIRNMWQSRYVHYVIAALAIYSCTAIIDRYLLSRAGVDPFAYTAAVHFFLLLNFLAMISVFHDGWRGIRNGFRTNGWRMYLVGFLTIGYRFTDVIAIQGAYAGLVAPVRSLSALFTTLIGGELFHERNLARKAVACLVMLAGAGLMLI